MVKRTRTSFSQFSFKLFGFFFSLKSCLVGNLDTGFKFKGKGNDWKASHKITQQHSQEESLIVPEALANSSCQWTKFPSPAAFPTLSLLTKKTNPSLLNTEELTERGGERLSKLLTVAFFTCLDDTQPEGSRMLFLHLTGWLSSYYVLGIVPRYR